MVWTISGILVQLVGLGVAAYGAWRVWRASGDKRGLFTGRKAPEVRLRWISSSVTGEAAPPPPAQPTTVEEHIDALRRDVETLREMWLEDRTNVITNIDAIQTDVSSLRSETVTAPRERALWDARLAFFGLAFAALGTVLQLFGASGL